jgi:hypothetical protein
MRGSPALLACVGVQRQALLGCASCSAGKPGQAILACPSGNARSCRSASMHCRTPGLTLDASASCLARRQTAAGLSPTQAVMLGAVTGGTSTAQQQQSQKPSATASSSPSPCGRGLGGGVDGGVHHDDPWIPAFAGMTSGFLCCCAFDSPPRCLRRAPELVVAWARAFLARGEAGCRSVRRQARDGLSADPATSEERRAPGYRASAFAIGRRKLRGMFFWLLFLRQEK